MPNSTCFEETCLLKTLSSSSSFFSFSKDASLTQVVFTLYAAVLAIWRQAGCCTYSVLKLNVMNDLKLPSDGN